MTKIDKEKILENAKEQSKKWLSAFNLDGKHNVDIIQEELSKRTFQGKPVLAYTVKCPKDVSKVLIKGVKKITDKTNPDEIIKIIKDLEPWDCVWDYYLMAFYEVAYSQCPDQSHEFGRQSFFRAFENGLGHIINLGSLIIGICLPIVFRDSNIKIHREDGPAIIWGKDKQWWLNGTQYNKRIVEAPHKITPHDIEKYGDAILERYIKHSKNMDSELFPYINSHSEIIDKIRKVAQQTV